MIHLDRLYWGTGLAGRGPGGVPGAPGRGHRRDSWVIDGGYLSSGGCDARIERADLVVLVEAPLAVCLARIVRRSLREDADAPAGPARRVR